MANQTYRLVIGYNPKQYDTGSTDPTDYLELDIVKTKNITLDNSIATQPMQSGDTISDHMYRNPTSISVSGTFGLNGRQSRPTITKSNDAITATFVDSYGSEVINDSQDRLSAIQNMFEYIKNQGILCTLTTALHNEDSYHYSPTKDENGKLTNRFKIRKNMALKSITWTEMLNTMDFTFGFQEVIMVGEQEYYNLPEDERTLHQYPKVNYGNAKSLSKYYSDTSMDDIFKETIKTMYEAGYITAAFLEYVANNDTSLQQLNAASNILNTVAIATAAVGTTIFVASLIAGTGTGLAALGAAATGLAALYPVGTIIAAGVALTAITVFTIKEIKKSQIEKEAKRKAQVGIDLINGSATEGLEKLAKLYSTIKNKLETMESDISVYTVDSEDSNQQVMMKVNGTIYIVDFFTNNLITPEALEIAVHNAKNEIVTGTDATVPVAKSVDELASNNNSMWFKNGDYQVYMVNQSLSLECNDTEEKLAVVKNTPTAYSIWVSKGNIENNLLDVGSIISESMIDLGIV